MIRPSSTAKLFGTDGIRCRAGLPPLDPETVSSIGSALVSLLGAGAKIIIGRDTRESGPWIEKALKQGIATAGGRAIPVGVITTPGVAFLTRKLDGDAGVVISASHNPYLDNGIKIFSPSGQKFSDEMEDAIAGYLVRRQLCGELRPVDGPAEVATELDSSPLVGDYIDHLTSHFTPQNDLRNSGVRGLRLVIDCANGAASAIAPLVFAELGANVTVIGASPDGRNINEQCGALHTEQLERKVVAESADLGLAFDGDADRLILVDSTGARHDGDSILFLLGRHLHQRGRLTGNRVVATIMSNFGLELAFRNVGIDLVRTAVGDKYVLEELLRRGGMIGGEQSGHVIFPDISLAGDGMITAIEVLKVMSGTGFDLAALTRDLIRTPQVVINLPVRQKTPLENIPVVQEALSDLQADLSSTGRVLVRYSGTENIVRIMIEGPNEMMIRERAELLAKLLSASLSQEDRSDSLSAD